MTSHLLTLLESFARLEHDPTLIAQAAMKLKRLVRILLSQSAADRTPFSPADKKVVMRFFELLTDAQEEEAIERALALYAIVMASSADCECRHLANRALPLIDGAQRVALQLADEFRGSLLKPERRGNFLVYPGMAS